MRRFRGKGVLVMVAALLLLGDMFWVRNGVPQLESDALSAESAASVTQVVVLASAQTPQDVPAAVHRPRPVSPVRIPVAGSVPSTKPTAKSDLPPIASVPATGPMVAQDTVSSPVVWLGSVPLPVAQSPVLRLDDPLPPRKWSPPQGIAYIRWWTA